MKNLKVFMDNNCNCEISVFVKKNGLGWSLRYRCHICLTFYNDWQVIDRLEKLNGYIGYQEHLSNLKSKKVNIRRNIKKITMPLLFKIGGEEVTEFFIEEFPKFSEFW